MKNKNQIAQNIANWYTAKTVAEFVKSKLSSINEQTKKIHADEIIESAIDKAKHEEDPKWSNFLFALAKGADEVAPPPAQNNFFIGAANVTDEALKKIIDVTPESKTKTKIEELI